MAFSKSYLGLRRLMTGQLSRLMVVVAEMIIKLSIAFVAWSVRCSVSSGPENQKQRAFDQTCCKEQFTFPFLLLSLASKALASFFWLSLGNGGDIAELAPQCC